MDLAIYTRDCERIGDRPALVLLPAFPYDHRMWEGVAQRFEGIPVIAVDGPGFGKTPVSNEHPSVELYADYVAQTLRSRGVKRIVPVGCSMGGYVAMALVDRYPRFVSGVALIGTHAGYDSFEVRAKRTEMAVNAMVGRATEALKAAVESQVGSTTAVERPELLDTLRSWIDDATGDGVAWAQRAMAARPGRLDILGRCHLPALVMHGQQDTIVSAQQAEDMAQKLSVSVRSIPRAGHLLPVETPAVVARALMSFYPRCV